MSPNKYLKDLIEKIVHRPCRLRCKIQLVAFYKITFVNAACGRQGAKACQF